MGYKRKARVLFLSSGNGSRSLMASCFANQLGVSWMEGRPAVFKKQGYDLVASFVMQEIGVSCTGDDLDELSEARLQWADLVVLMDKMAEVQCPPLPQGVQKRSYFFDDPAEMAGFEVSQNESYRKVRDQIKRRVEGMIGGLNMLQKTSE